MNTNDYESRVVAAKKAAVTNKKRYGKDFYSKIGSEGGKRGNTGGFYGNKKLAAEAGKRGGQKSAENRWGKVH